MKYLDNMYKSIYTPMYYCKSFLGQVLISYFGHDPTPKSVNCAPWPNIFTAELFLHGINISSS